MAGRLTTATRESADVSIAPGVRRSPWQAFFCCPWCAAQSPPDVPTTVFQEEEAPQGSAGAAARIHHSPVADHLYIPAEGLELSLKSRRGSSHQREIQEASKANSWMGTHEMPIQTIKGKKQMPQLFCCTRGCSYSVAADSVVLI